MSTATLALPSPARPPTVRPRLGFLGVGWIGHHRMMAIAAAGCAEIAAIADPAEAMVQQAAAHAPDAALGATLDDLLALDLDGLVIATPSAQHAREAVAALERGLAVFCQKPLGRNAAEVRAVVQAARAADRLLGVDLSYRHTAALQAMRPIVRAGELGEIFAVDLVFHNAYGPQKAWFHDPEQSGGGCVLDLGIHLVDAALWLLETSVISVNSRLFRQEKRLRRRGEACEDYATARLDLASGAVVDLRCSWGLHAGCGAVIEAAFYGTRGSVALRNVNGSFFDFVAERRTGTARETLAAPPDDWGGRAAVDWARQLAAGRRYDPAVERLIGVAETLDAIYEHAGDE